MLLLQYTGNVENVCIPCPSTVFGRIQSGLGQGSKANANAIPTNVLGTSPLALASWKWHSAPISVWSMEYGLYGVHFRVLQSVRLLALPDGTVVVCNSGAKGSRRINGRWRGQSASATCKVEVDARRRPLDVVDEASRRDHLHPQAEYAICTPQLWRTLGAIGTTLSHPDSQHSRPG